MFWNSLAKSIQSSSSPESVWCYHRVSKICLQEETFWGVSKDDLYKVSQGSLESFQLHMGDGDGGELSFLLFTGVKGRGLLRIFH